MSKLTQYFAAQAEFDHLPKLKLPFDVRQKFRFEAQDEQQQTHQVFLPRSTQLRPLDALGCDERPMLQVIAADEPVHHLSSDDPFALMRACYHLGNRHVALQITPQWLQYQPCPVLKQMLEQLGFHVDEISAPFTPEPGAYHRGTHAH